MKMKEVNISFTDGNNDKIVMRWEANDLIIQHVLTDQPIFITKDNMKIITEIDAVYRNNKKDAVDGVK